MQENGPMIQNKNVGIQNTDTQSGVLVADAQSSVRFQLQIHAFSHNFPGAVRKWLDRGFRLETCFDHWYKLV